MAAVALFRAGSEEHDIQLKLRGEFSETQGLMETDGPGRSAGLSSIPISATTHRGDLGPVTKTFWAFVSSETWW